MRRGIHNCAATSGPPPRQRGSSRSRFHGAEPRERPFKGSDKLKVLRETQHTAFHCNINVYRKADEEDE